MLSLRCEAGLFVHLEHHDDGGVGEDRVRELGRHVGKGAGFDFPGVITECQAGLAADKIEAGCHRRGVGRQFLAGGEGENEDFDVVAGVKCAAENAVVWNRGLSS